jgi:hypothetical protein
MRPHARRAKTVSRERRERSHRRRRERAVISSAARFAIERSKRRAEYAHMLVAGVLGMLEADIADLDKALASEDAVRTLSADSRRGVPQPRKAAG